MINRINHFVILSLFCFCNSVLFPQNFISRTYTVEDGLPDAKVFDVLQDSSGLMWFATRSGICTYDGNEWKMLDQKQSGNIKVQYVRMKLDKHNRVWALPYSAFDSIKVFRNSIKIKSFSPILLKGRHRTTCSTFDVGDFQDSILIVVGTLGDGSYYLKDSTWNKINLFDYPARNYITKVLIIDSSVFISSYKGLFKFVNNPAYGNIVHFNNLPHTNVIDLEPEFSNYDVLRIWVLGENWVGYLQDEKFFPVSLKLKYFWVGAKNYSFLTITPDHHRLYYGNSIASFFIDIKINGNTQSGGNNKYISPAANSLSFDFEGNQWIATSRGVVKRRPAEFSRFDKNNGLLENEVTAISQMYDGSMIIGHDFGITIMNDSGIRTVRIPGANNSTGILTRILDICSTNNKSILMSSFRKGIWQINPDFSSGWFNSNDNVRYYSVFCTDDNHLLIGTDLGVYELLNNSILRTKDFNITDDVIRRIYQTSDRTVLFGMVTGLFSVNGNKYKKFNSDNFDGDNIYSIYEKKGLGVLLGTQDGLYILNADSLVKLKKDNFSINRPVYFIIEDHQGQLWFGTNYGVYKWDGTNTVHYTTADGLSGNETNRAAGFVDKEGNVWIGTEGGLSKFSPGNTVSTFIRPKIDFLYLSDSQNHKFKSTSTVQLGSSQHNLSFYYQGYSFINEERNLYEIELLNLGNNSMNIFKTKENVVRFSNMSPGTYRFSVRFRNANGMWSDSTVGITFAIAKPFYYQYWFYGGMVLLVSFIVFIIMQRSSRLKMIRSAEKQMIRSSAILETTENERKRITRDLHDGLGQLLASAKFKIELFKQKAGIKNNELDAAVDLLLEARNEIKNLIHDLHPAEIERYGLSVALEIMCEKIRENTSINVRCNCGNYEQIKKRNLEIMVYRIIQEALSNVIKHAGASRVDINLNRNESGISVSIKDNGTGFDFSGFDSYEGNSMGLINMYERTNILGGKLKIDSKKGNGTIVQLNIPV